MREVTHGEKNTWNESVIKNKGSFLQSWEWGEFQKRLGRKIWRFIIPSQENFSIKQNAEVLENFSILCVQYPFPFKKSYLYCPRLIFTQDEGWPELVSNLALIAKKEEALFLRIDPEILQETLENSFFEKHGFRKSRKQIQPKSTAIVTLDVSEEELLRRMKPKTRYNIKLAQRKDLDIIHCESPEDKEKYFEDFYQLIRETAERNKFHLHPKHYYHAQLMTIPFARLFAILYQKKVIASAIVIFFGKRATYLHGASSSEYKNVMAPYRLHWEIMRYAKQQGYNEYDFWGISGSTAALSSQNEKDTWDGITRFKKGFGGQEFHYIGAYDYVFRQIWYKGYEYLRRIMKK